MATVNVQGRIDMRSLATVARAYIERGSTFATRSDLIWKIVEDASIAAERAGAFRPETDEEAHEYLLTVGINIAASDRGRRQMRNVLIQDTGVHDHFGADLFAGRMTRGKQKKIGDNLDSVESRYRLALNAGYRGSLQEFIEEDKKTQEILKRMRGESEGPQPSEEVVRETVDEAAFAEKEAKRLAAEKAAYSPEALRAAMQPREAGEGS